MRSIPARRRAAHSLTKRRHTRCLAAAMSSPPPTLDDRHPFLQSVHSALQLRHYSPKTTEAYVSWVRRFVSFYNLREVSALLSDSSNPR